MGELTLLDKDKRPADGYNSKTISLTYWNHSKNSYVHDLVIDDFSRYLHHGQANIAPEVKYIKIQFKKDIKFTEYIELDVPKLIRLLKSNHNKKQLTAKIKKEKQKAFNKSPAAFSKSACSWNSELTTYRIALAKEKRIERTSGTINVFEKYKLGKGIIYREDMVKLWSKKYKKATGKSWSSSQCK